MVVIMIREIITIFLLMQLSGCGNHHHQNKTENYRLNLKVNNKDYGSNDNDDLPYNQDVSLNITLNGGSSVKSNYPSGFAIEDKQHALIFSDPHHCLHSTHFIQHCNIIAHNTYAGPDVSKGFVDHLQARTTISTNLVSNDLTIPLDGHLSKSDDIFYLTENTYQDRAPFYGLLHNGLQYQLALYLSNPAKAWMPTQASITELRVAPLDPHAMVLRSWSCHQQVCTINLENQYVSSHPIKPKIQYISIAANINHQVIPNQKLTIPLHLPSMQPCQYQDGISNQSGLSLQPATIAPYLSGKPLTAVQYTSRAMNKLYPLPMNSTPIHSHMVVLTLPSTPNVFGPHANVHIPGSVEPDDALTHHHCSDFQSKVTPFTYPGSVATSTTTQQCYQRKQLRYVYFALPVGQPPSSHGWPVIIMLHGSGGQGGGYYLTPADQQQHHPISGSANQNVFNNGWDWHNWEVNPIQPKPTGSIYSYSYYVRMRLIKTLLSRGFAVVVPTTWNAGAYDWWDFEPNYDQPWPYTQASWPLPKVTNKHYQDVDSALTYMDMAYWPGMDKQFFSTLLAFLDKPSDYSTGMANHTFDLNNLFIMGYSAGANMVSRLMNEFPRMTYTPLRSTVSKPFPTIKGAIMLSGGSYSCYINGNQCPADAMEQRYASTNAMLQHPPTLIAESLYDDNAGPKHDPAHLAGSVYYQSFLDQCPVGSSCRPSNQVGQGVLAKALYQPLNPIQIIHTNNINIHHYYFPEMVIPTLNLLLAHTCVPLDDSRYMK